MGSGHRRLQSDQELLSLRDVHILEPEEGAEDREEEAMGSRASHRPRESQDQRNALGADAERRVEEHRSSLGSNVHTRLSVEQTNITQIRQCMQSCLNHELLHRDGTMSTSVH